MEDSSARSPISNYVLGPFWTWFVTLWPKTVAPNTVSTSWNSEHTNAHPMLARLRCQDLRLSLPTLPH